MPAAHGFARLDRMPGVYARRPSGRVVRAGWGGWTSGSRDISPGYRSCGAEERLTGRRRRTVVPNGTSLGRRASRASRVESIHVGTSGWTHDDWDGPFYPDGVGGPDRLSFYASRFDTVEVNASFHRFPTGPMIDAWNRRLPPDFHLVLKGHRQITHRKKLVDCGEPLAAFLGRVTPLATLRVLLWQLPPSLHRDTSRLEGFLARLDRSLGETAVAPRRIRHAMEFRHESWWDEATAEVLSRHGAAFVAVSHPSLPEEVVPTADVLYVRFHGKGRRLYDYDYSDDELGEWVRRLAPHLRGRTLYAFFNNDWHANAPRNAARLRELL